jgi:hypothetical protein
LGVLLSWNPTLAAGVYYDAAGEVAFLIAPQSRALAGRIVRSNGDAADASLMFVDLVFPVRSSSLVEVDIPVVSFLDTSEVVTGFGDVTVRGRTRLYGAPRRILHLTGALRTGTGTSRVFPYTSKSIDFEAGLAYVDTLSVLQYWAWAVGAYASNQPKDTPEEELYGPYGRLSGGIGLPFASGSLNLGLGLTAAFFEAGRTRELVFAGLDYRRSPWIRFMVFGHVESGDSDERVSDYAAGAGLWVIY